jgi:cobalt-zinc-cadmium efflux system outer membrane protein
MPSPPVLPNFREKAGDGPDGLTLDAAIERLLASNTDLAARFQDIPKARADVLTAGLRNDPVVFLTASPIPYGRFSPQRPGTTAYDITIVQALDLNGKHKTSKRAAQKMIPVLEARYQDAVRHKIDELYTVYVNVLAARAVREVTRANLDRLTEIVEKSRNQVPQGKHPPIEITRASLRRASARIALQRVEATLVQSRRDLGILLAVPPDQASHLRVRGTLRDLSPPPPCTEELIQLALRARPDLAAHRLSVARADAEVQRERAEALEDFFLFYSPYQATDLSPQNKQSTSSWEIGVLVPMPFFNRNQGEIARARANAVQWRIEVEKEEQEVIDEVRQAATEYAVSRQLVQRYERQILPSARKVRDDKYRAFVGGEKDAGPFLSAQKDYDEIVLLYLEALVRHRRSMLRLNTAVGQRILP